MVKTPVFFWRWSKAKFDKSNYFLQDPSMWLPWNHNNISKHDQCTQRMSYPIYKMHHLCKTARRNGWFASTKVNNEMMKNWLITCWAKTGWRPKSLTSTKASKKLKFLILLPVQNLTLWKNQWATNQKILSCLKLSLPIFIQFVCFFLEMIWAMIVLQQPNSATIQHGKIAKGCLGNAPFPSMW